MEINLNVANKIVELLSHGLVSGLGTPIPGQMCVEAVVCQALGLPHGDEPGCVMTALRTFKIKINDSNWSSPQTRAKGLKRLALIQLGSLGMDEIVFVKGLATLAQKWAAKAAKAEEGAWAAKGANWAKWAAEAAAKWAESAAESAAANWAESAAAEAAEAAVAAAKWAESAAESAWANWAESAAEAAEAAKWAAESAKWAYDKVLASCCEDVVQLLRSMNAPGAQWLSCAE